jgi:hypothetical protein
VNQAPKIMKSEIYQLCCISCINPVLSKFKRLPKRTFRRKYKLVMIDWPWQLLELRYHTFYQWQNTRLTVLCMLDICPSLFEPNITPTQTKKLSLTRTRCDGHQHHQG